MEEDRFSVETPPRPRATFATKKKKKADVVFYTHFEEVLQKVNPFGPYQIFCFIVMLYTQVEWAGNTEFMQVLGSLEPDWNCSHPDGSYATVHAPTGDYECSYISNTCSSIVAEKNSVEFLSVVGAFKLICGDKNKVNWIQMIQSGGALIGSIVGGHMGDHYGRKTIFFTGQLLIVITSIMSTAAQNWIAFSVLQACFSFLYGVIEVTSLTLMMEYTSNKYRMVMASAFQWPFAYMTIALIAFLTKDWQNYFVFLNLVSSPLIIAFMLFLESPRWLIATGRLNKACDVLNDIAHARWNNTKSRFTQRDLSSIHKTVRTPFYNFYHLFCNFNLAKQSVMQMLSMFTYAMVSSTYIYTINGVHDNAIMFTFLDGVFRLATPFIIVTLDLLVPGFGRKIQFMGALLLEGALFGTVIGLVQTGTSAITSTEVTILVIIATMINDCVFWINIVQITTQRYPTVIRCIAFGCLHSVKHVGAIVGVLIMQPLLDSSWPVGVFVVPEGLIILTLVLGLLLVPETKGKALMDQMVELNFGRLENELPRALIRLAAGHKVAQSGIRETLRKDMEAVQNAERLGETVADSPWKFKGEKEVEEDICSRNTSIRQEVAEFPVMSEQVDDRYSDMESDDERIELHYDNDGIDEDSEEEVLPTRMHYDNDGFDEDPEEDVPTRM